MLQQVLDKGDVGRYTSDPELPKGAVHARNRSIRRLCFGGHLHQQAVIVTRDDATGICCAAIQPDTHTCCLAESCDAAIVRDEVVLWILGGNPRLQRVAVQAHVILRGFVCGFRNRLAFGDQYLCLNDVDSGHLFGDCVFHLNTGVHLNEIEFAVCHIHQEFDCASTFVVHVFAYLVAQLANFGALIFRQIGRGCALHDFLVPALDRAVTLVEVVHVAVLIAQNLNLDVARLEDHFFQITFTVAKSGFGLATAFQNFFFQLTFGHDGAHSATTTAP